MHDDWERLATNLRIQNALCEVLPLLDGLPTVVFKGPCLTQLIYGDLRQRASSDNDVWVPEPYTTEALERLLAAGYAPEPHIDPRAALERFGQVALLAPHGGVPLDLHAHPFSRRFFDVPDAELGEQLITMQVGPLDVTTFNRLASFAHMVAHYVQHLLEPEHLDSIAAAWRAWGPEFGSAEITQIKRWISPAAFEFTLLKARTITHGDLQIPPLTDRKARLVDALTRHSLHPLAQRALAQFLVAPQKSLQNAALFVFLTPEELHSRYGVAPLWRLHLRHLSYLLRS